MDVTVITDSDMLLNTYNDLVSWATELHLVYAWASSNGGKAPHWKSVDLKKVKRAVIGIHFAQTEPSVLRVLNNLGVLKVLSDTSGVFHPKVIVGQVGTHLRAIIGSSNFTTGGFGKNTEVNVLLEGRSDGYHTPLRPRGPLDAVCAFVNMQWSRKDAFKPTTTWLDDYKRARRKQPKPPTSPPAIKANRPALPLPTNLNIDFNTYYNLIASQHERRLGRNSRIYVFDSDNGAYLQEAEACQSAFRAYRNFADMPVDTRQLVGGWGPHTSGFFGDMRPAGNFKARIRHDAASISKHLDRIPLKGKVSGQLAEEVLHGLDALKGFNIATASRLLTVKRPDLFLSVNSANRAAIKTLFNVAPWNGVKQYLDLHSRLWKMLWFKSEEPEKWDQRRVWRARVALLDAALYNRRA